MNEDLVQLLKDYVTTVNSGKYRNWEEVDQRFAETQISRIDKQLLKDYVATVNSGKYKDWDEVNYKFSQILGEPLKKKESAGESQTPSLESSGAPSQESAGTAEKESSEPSLIGRAWDWVKSTVSEIGSTQAKAAEGMSPMRVMSPEQRIEQKKTEIDKVAEKYKTELQSNPSQFYFQYQKDNGVAESMVTKGGSIPAGFDFLKLSEEEDSAFEEFKKQQNAAGVVDNKLIKDSWENYKNLGESGRDPLKNPLPNEWVANYQNLKQQLKSYDNPRTLEYLSKVRGFNNDVLSSRWNKIKGDKKFIDALSTIEGINQELESEKWKSIPETPEKKQQQDYALQKVADLEQQYADQLSEYRSIIQLDTRNKNFYNTAMRYLPSAVAQKTEEKRRRQYIDEEYERGKVNINLDAMMIGPNPLNIAGVGFDLETMSNDGTDIPSWMHQIIVSGRQAGAKLAGYLVQAPQTIRNLALAIPSAQGYEVKYDWTDALADWADESIKNNPVIGTLPESVTDLPDGQKFFAKNDFRKGLVEFKDRADIKIKSEGTIDLGENLTTGGSVSGVVQREDEGGIEILMDNGDVEYIKNQNIQTIDRKPAEEVDIEWSRFPSAGTRAILDMATLVFGGRAIAKGVGMTAEFAGLGVSEAAESSTGLIAASYLITAPEYYRSALDVGLPNPEAFATASAAITSAIELVSPNKILTSGLTRSSYDGFTRVFRESLLSGKTAKGSLADAGKFLAKEVGLENVQEITQGLADLGLEYSMNEMYDRDMFDVSKKRVISEGIETVLLTTLATSVMSAPNTFKLSKSVVPYHDAVDFVARNKDKYMPIVEQMLNDTNADPVTANRVRDDISERISVLDRFKDKKGYWDRKNRAELSEDDALNAIIDGRYEEIEVFNDPQMAMQKAIARNHAERQASVGSIQADKSGVSSIISRGNKLFLGSFNGQQIDKTGNLVRENDDVVFRTKDGSYNLGKFEDVSSKLGSDLGLRDLSNEEHIQEANDYVANESKKLSGNVAEQFNSLLEDLISYGLVKKEGESYKISSSAARLINFSSELFNEKTYDGKLGLAIQRGLAYNMTQNQAESLSKKGATRIIRQVANSVNLFRTAVSGLSLRDDSGKVVNFKDSKYIMLNDKTQATILARSMGKNVSAGTVTTGWYDTKTNTMFFVADKKAPIHEAVMHPLVDAIRQLAPSVYDRFADEIDNIKSSEGLSYSEESRDRGYKGDSVKEEGIVRLLTDVASGRIYDSGVLGRINDALFRMINSAVGDNFIGESLGFTRKAEVKLDDLVTIQDLAKSVADAIARGQEIDLISGLPNKKRKVKKRKTVKEQPDKNAKQARPENSILDLETDFGGKLSKPAELISYSKWNGIEYGQYANKDTGVIDVYIAAFGDNDYLAYIRVYNEDGSPTNRFTSKLQRKSDRAGATKEMITELQKSLPKNHEYAEDISVSLDGIKWFKNQLTKGGYELLKDENGNVVTTRIGLGSGEGDFSTISITSKKSFDTYKKTISDALSLFSSVDQNYNPNISWESSGGNMTAVFNFPVLVKTEDVKFSQEKAPKTQEELEAAVDRFTAKAQNFPEVVIPEVVRTKQGKIAVDKDGDIKYVTQPYKLMDGAKMHISEDLTKAEDIISDKLVEDYNKNKKRKEVASGIGWYSKMRDWFQRNFGANIEMFGQILAATSAQTEVIQNFNNTIEAMVNYSRGMYDGLLNKYHEYLLSIDAMSDQQLLDMYNKRYRDNLPLDKFAKEKPEFISVLINDFPDQPLKSNGTKFNANGPKVLQALWGNWLQQTKGPKTKNFAGNLTGRSLGPTIDLWAARYLRRVIYSGAVQRWRILPEVETGVQFNELVSGELSGDYPFAERIMQKAADKLKMNADDLQAFLWYLEKDTWDKNGWTENVAAKRKASFEEGAATLKTERYQLGVTTYRKELFDKNEFEKARNEIKETIGKLDGIIIQRVTASEGLYFGDTEPSFDVEFTVRAAGGYVKDGQFLKQKDIEDFKESDQKAINKYNKAKAAGKAVEAPSLYFDEAGNLSSRAINEGISEFAGTDVTPVLDKLIEIGKRYNQDSVLFSKVVDSNADNARPMFEIGLKRPVENSPLINRIIKLSSQKGIAGYSIARDSRGNILGIRTQYVPEFDNNPNGAQDFLDAISKIRRSIKNETEISYIKNGFVDTKVIFTNAIQQGQTSQGGTGSSIQGMEQQTGQPVGGDLQGTNITPESGADTSGTQGTDTRGYGTTDQQVQGDVKFSQERAGDLVTDTLYAPHMTSDNAGNYVFFHVTSAPFKDISGGIDSRKFYSTRTSRQEKSLQYGVASYYTKPSESESMVLGDSYYVKVPASKVYPMNTDPNGYERVADGSMPKNEPFRYEKIRQEMAQLAKNDGYQMAVGYWGLNEKTGSVRRGMNALRADALVPLKPNVYNEENENFIVGEQAGGTKFSQEKIGKIKWEKSVEGKGDPSISRRNEVVQEAAKDLKEGKITNEEYRATVSENSPILPITIFFEPATYQEINNALSSDKQEKVNSPIEENSIVGLRLDIPAYRNNNTWVVSVHEGSTNAGRAISYRNVARITDVTFGVEPKGALNIAAGKEKATIGRMFGSWKNIQGDDTKQKGESAKQMIQDIVDNPNWIQVGMNPFRHSYFYDRNKNIGKPVLKAEEVIQVGGLVYAKNPVYGEWTDEAFTVKGLLDRAGNDVKFSQEKIGITETSKRIAGVGDVNAAVNQKLTEMYNNDPKDPIFSKSVQSIKDALNLWDGTSAQDLYSMMDLYGGDKILNYVKDNRGDKNMSLLLLIEVFKKASAAGDNDLAISAYNELNMIGSTSGQLLNQMRQLQPLLLDPNAPRAVRAAVNRRAMSKIIMAEISNSGTVLTSDQKVQIDNLIEQYVTSIVNEHEANKQFLKVKNKSGYTSKEISDARKKRNEADKKVNEAYGNIIVWASGNVLSKTGNVLSNLLQGLLLTYKSHVANAVSNILNTVEVVPQLAGPAFRSAARGVGFNVKGAGLGQSMLASYFAGRAFLETMHPAVVEAFSKGGMRPRSVVKFETGRQIMPYTAMKQIYRETANTKAIGMLYKLFTGKDIDKYTSDLLPKALKKNKDGSVEEYTPMDIVMSKMLEGSVGWIALNNFRGLYIFDRISGQAARTFAAAKLMTEYNGVNTTFNIDDVKDFMFNMTPEQADKVDRYAKIFLYSDNESLFAKGGQRLSKFLSNTADDLEKDWGLENKEVQRAADVLRLIGTTLVPYATVPSNMAAHMIELAIPIIPAIGATYYYKRGDNNIGDMLVGRAILGTAFYSFAMTLISFVTAGEDDDKSKDYKLKQELGGSKSFNKSKFLRWINGGEDIDAPFEEDDEIISLQRYGTFGAFLNYMASLRESLIDKNLWDESFIESMSQAPIDVISSSLGSSTRATMDMSVFHQQSMLFKAIQESGSERKNPMSKFITGQIETASNLVWPNQVSQLTQAYDAYTETQPYILRADDPNFVTMLKERLAKRNFPFVEAPSTLYPVLSLWGKPVEITGGQSLDPNNTRFVSDKAVIEVSRLMKSLNAKSPINLAATSLEINDVNYSLNETDMHALEMVAGGIREGLIKELIFNNTGYEFADDLKRYEAIQTLGNKANNTAIKMYKSFIVESMNDGKLRLDPITKKIEWTQDQMEPQQVVNIMRQNANIGR